MRIEELFRHSAAAFPGNVAVIDSAGNGCTYGDLLGRVETLAALLHRNGIRPGDRVGIRMEKSVSSVAAILAVLAGGCAYVPIDPDAPVSRAAFILNDCTVGAVITDQQLGDELTDQLLFKPLIICDSGSRCEVSGSGSPASEADDRTAYILYTSGSTGVPKGVVHSHSGALAFIEWCSDLLKPSPPDCFSSHSPFHFDLSILDLFVPLAHGSRIVLFDSATARDPRRIAQTLFEQDISIWYSTPTALTTLMAHGKMDRFDFRALQTILFAGEVFPPVHLRKLRSFLPKARYVNLYGPTETNVCTFYELPPNAEVPDSGVPIGKPCEHIRHRVVSGSGKLIRPGEEGELLINGESVMTGYWRLPDLNRTVFTDGPGGRWYRTGDRVREGADGNLHFLGRRDRMVKRRGYRIELGEIEHLLISHEQLEHAAVIATPAGATTRITAFYAAVRGSTVSTLEIREYLGGRLSPQMIPDAFVRLDRIPETSNHKTDYHRLKEMA